MGAIRNLVRPQSCVLHTTFPAMRRSCFSVAGGGRLVAATLIAVGAIDPGHELKGQAVVTLNDLQQSGPAVQVHLAAAGEFALLAPLATSDNLIGYVKLALRPGWSLIANQLFEGNSTVASSLKGVPEGTTVLLAGPEGWIADNLLDGWTDPRQPLVPGMGAFVFNPQTNPVSVTFVGEVMSGTTVVELPAGPSLAASVIPQQITPGPDVGLPLETGDSVFKWTGDQFAEHIYADGWSSPPPVIGVAEGFVVRKQHAGEWRRTFAINQNAAQIRRAAEDVVYRIALPALTNDTPQVNLFTWNGDPAFGRVLDVDGVTPVADGFVAELWGAANPTEELRKLGGPFEFRSGASAGWLREGALALPQFKDSSSVWLQLRVWHEPWHVTFAEAEAAGARVGRSSIFEVPTASAASLKPLSQVNTFPSFTLISHPRIRIADTEIDATAGTDLVIAPTVIASAPVNWQWTFGQSKPLTEETNSTLILRNLTSADGGSYRLTGTNEFGNSQLFVRVTVLPQRPVAHVLATPSLAWTTGGPSEWFGQITDRHSGPAAARSGAVTHGEESWLEAAVSGPGLLSFWWKVSSETNWDHLEVHLDGELRDIISGEVDWRRGTLEVPAGEHAVRWRYSKDENLSVGFDHGWLDDVVFIPRGVVPSIVAEPQGREVGAGSPVEFTVEAKGVPAPTFQWLHDGQPIEGATNSVLSFIVSQQAHAGDYAVVVSNAAGSMTSAAATLSVIIPPPPSKLAEAGAALLLNWPASADFVLESSGRIGAGAIWRAVEQSPIPVGDQMALPLPRDGETTFYRLRLR
jgi:hypothetical protein